MCCTIMYLGSSRESVDDKVAISRLPTMLHSTLRVELSPICDFQVNFLGDEKSQWLWLWL